MQEEHLTVVKSQSCSFDYLFPAISIAILLVGTYFQFQTFINHDVAWVLYSSSQLLDGAVFGRDIIAANPPLIWWILAIPNAIARMTGLQIIELFRIFVLLLSGLSLLGSSKLLFDNSNFSLSRALFVTLGAWLLVFAVHRDFGQREHFAVIFVLPYIAALARRIDGSEVSLKPGIWIGILAGIGISLKPFFVLVPLLLEGLLYWTKRNKHFFVRPEAIGATLTCVIYLVGIILFASPWLLDVVPSISKAYWAFEQPFISSIKLFFVPLIIPFALFLFVYTQNRTNAASVFALAAIGFFLAAVLQAKYYSYHIYPVQVFLLLAIALSAKRMSYRSSLAVLFFVAMTGTLLVAYSWRQIQARTIDGNVGQSIASISTFVSANVPIDGTFLGLSTHPFPGFPTTMYAQRGWASPSNSSIYLPAVVRLRSRNRSTEDVLLNFVEQKAWDAAFRDISRKPDLVLIDERPIRHAIGARQFDILAFYMEDPRFRHAWLNYRKLPSSPAGFNAYVRKLQNGR